MAVWILILATSWLAAGQECVLDEFAYANVEQARQAWVAAEGSPAVEVTGAPAGTMLKIPAPFASRPKLSRVVYDRKVNLELSEPGEFVLQMRSDSPPVAEWVTLYFRSGPGWYAAGGHLHHNDWQTLRFTKALFRTEGQPAGWHAIDGIRIAVWRGQGQDTAVYLRRLTAITHEVAVIMPPATADEPEIRTARLAAERISRMLDELGLGSDAIAESALRPGVLGRRKIAVLPLNPSLPPEALDALEQFLASGGKVFLCYSSLQPRLAKLLGFRRTEYLREQRSGQFAEIRFQAPDVAALPQSVKQASWNIITAEPAGDGARIIGQWFDEAGKPTGQPAMLLSEHGAYLSHILLEDDREGKKQLLAAVLGQLAPALWRTMAQTTLERASVVGHCRNLDELAAVIKGSQVAAAQAKLVEAQAALAQAARRVQQDDGPQSVVQARTAHAALVRAYLLAQPSRANEGRAVWNHSGTGAWPGDWERSAKNLADAGVNLVLPNMLWAGLAHYPSELLPRSKVFEQHGDQIAQCVAAAKRHGLEVHVWKVNWNLAGAPRDFIEQMRREGRTQVAVDGQPVDWLCPSHPANQKLELDSLLEVARNYAVDGLHFDYIRYLDRNSCYCPGCKDRFEGQTGKKVTDWPRDAYRGERQAEYANWRCAQITKLVAAVRQETKKLRPELKLSAAVFAEYPAGRESVGQDWPAWVAAGYLDFLCPMDYTDDDRRFAQLVAAQLALVAGRIPVYPGIGVTSSHSSLTADHVAGQVHCARQAGAAGFVLFNYSRDTAETIIPALGLGVGARPATLPHRAR